MKLTDLIQGLTSIDVRGNMEREIASLSFDSREIQQGSMYVALKGLSVDGHRFITSAVEAGAVCVVCEVLPENRSEDVCWIHVEDSRKAIAWLAASWYGHPSRELKLVGVTGTNGKTTIATLLYKVHNTGLGYKAGILSTIEVRVHDEVFPATHTTPDPIQLNAMLRKMVDVGCEFCFMEVSSHAASQHRIFGLDFDGGIFTNLTHEHLDYHKISDPTWRRKNHFSTD